MQVLTTTSNPLVSQLPSESLHVNHPFELLADLKTYPEQKHEECDAVYSPLTFLGYIPETFGIHFKVTEDAVVEIDSIKTTQLYVYRSKLRWYMQHPKQIEEPQLHQAKYWWRASVWMLKGVTWVGNGNHRVSAAKLLGWKTMRVRTLVAA